jgi:hypothetical protein
MTMIRRRVFFVLSDVSEERIASIFRAVEWLGMQRAVATALRCRVFFVLAKVSEERIATKNTRHLNPEDDFLHVVQNFKMDSF